MTIYFVRHGQTEGNHQKVHQSPEVDLSTTGREQVEHLAKRLEAEKIEYIVSSSYKRALSTTDIIAQRLQREVVVSDLFTEVRRPSEIFGLSTTGPEAGGIKSQLLENAHDPEWHYSDEENYHEVLDRARQALSFLESLNKEHILVVTHGHFLKVLVCVALFKEELTHNQYYSFYQHAVMRNGGLTLMRYYEKQWKLLTWNEHAYLPS